VSLSKSIWHQTIAICSRAWPWRAILRGGRTTSRRTTMPWASRSCTRDAFGGARSGRTLRAGRIRGRAVRAKAQRRAYDTIPRPRGAPLASPSCRASHRDCRASHAGWHVGY